MRFEDRFEELLDPVTPTLKRQEGYIDAVAGKPPLSNDEHYTRGFAMGVEAQKNAEQKNSQNSPLG